MNTKLKRIFTIFSILAFANVFVEQAAQAKAIHPVNSKSELTSQSKTHTSQETSILLVQSNADIDDAPVKESSMSSQESSFTDVDRSYWAYSFIQTLAAQNLISGFPDSSFRPDQVVTRAEAAAMIHKTFELPTLEVKKPQFSDVPVDYWAAPAIESAYKENFVSAYPNNLFLPEQSITKVELIDYLASGLKLTSSGSAVDIVNSYYIDAKQIPVYAVDEVAAATEANMVINYPDLQTFNPESSVTRAEMVAHLYQTLVKLGKIQPIATNEQSASYIVSNPEQTISQTLVKSTEVEETERQASSNDKLAQNRRLIGPSAPNYFGIGGSLGLIDDTFGDFGAFAVTSKVRLLSLIDSPEGGTDVSLRPSAIIGEDVTFAVPVTIDVRLDPFIDIGNEAIVPYFGPGVIITTGDDSVFKFLMAAGLDVPIGEFTTNAQFNIGFLDDTALGLTLSVGYNF